MMQVLDDAREMRSVKCDFLSEQEMTSSGKESQQQMAARVKLLKSAVLDLAKDHGSILIVGHKILFLFLTSSDLDGVIAGKASVDGTHLRNCELKRVILWYSYKTVFKKTYK